jgi:diguanylate cyclase (GGDEF)-like protein
MMGGNVYPGGPGRTAEDERDWLLRVLRVQTDLQDLYIRHGADRSWWAAALRNLIALSGSEFGFLGRVDRDPDNRPFLQTLAITDIAWNEWSRRLFDEYAVAGLEFRNLDSLFGVTLATGDVVVSEDPARDPRRCGLPPGHPPLTGYIGLPLKDGETLIGMLGLANCPGGYSPSLEEHLRPVLSVVGLMITRDITERRAAAAIATAADLGGAVEDLMRREREHAAIATAVSRIIAAPATADAADTLRDLVAELSPDMQAIVLLEDPEDPALVRNLHFDALGKPDAQISREDCVALQSGRTHLSMPGLRLGACAHADPTDAVTICTPLATVNDEYGLLVTRVREMPAGDTAAQAAHLAEDLERVAGALAQLALRQDLTSRALRDDLTGLPNRAALLQAVKRRLSRIDGATRPFGIMILDIDDFKGVNDRFGHAVGDDVLIATAFALQEAVRDDDFVARLGGDEFVVVLGSGTHDIMRSAGERLIAEVAQIDPPGLSAPLSASAGAVAVGWGDVTWEDAYEAADVLLYEAKGAGKAQVAIGGLLGTPAQP